MWKGTLSLLGWAPYDSGSAALTPRATSWWNLKQKVTTEHPQTNQEALRGGCLPLKRLMQFISISAWIFEGFWGLGEDTEWGQDVEDWRDPKPQQSTMSILHMKLISLWRLTLKFWFCCWERMGSEGAARFVSLLSQNVFLPELWTCCYADKPVYGVTYLTTALVARGSQQRKGQRPQTGKDIIWGKKSFQAFVLYMLQGVKHWTSAETIVQPTALFKWKCLQKPCQQKEFIASTWLLAYILQ